MNKLFYRIIKSNTNITNKNVLFLHGLLGNNKNLNIIGNNKLFNNYNKIYIDLPNHYNSYHYSESSIPFMSNEIAKILTDLNMSSDNLTIIGHSLGGKIGLYLKYMNKCKDIIILDILPVDYYSNNDNNMGIFIDNLNNIDFNNKNFTQLKNEITDISKQFDFINYKQISEFILTNLTISESKNYRWKPNMPVLNKYYKDIISFDFKDLKLENNNGIIKFIGGNKSNYVQKKFENNVKKVIKDFNFDNDVKMIDAGHWVHFDNISSTMDAIKLSLNI